MDQPVVVVVSGAAVVAVEGAGVVVVVSGPAIMAAESSAPLASAPSPVLAQPATSWRETPVAGAEEVVMSIGDRSCGPRRDRFGVW